jgi:hypothetical protein
MSTGLTRGTRRWTRRADEGTGRVDDVRADEGTGVKEDGPAALGRQPKRRRMSR